MLDACAELLKSLDYKSSGFTLILLAALAWLFRSWIGKRLAAEIQIDFDKQLENFKTDESMRLESFKAGLAITNAAIESMQDRLQERRIAAVGLLYASLARVYRTTGEYVRISRHGLADYEALLADLNAALSEFHDVFPRNRLFLPQVTAQAVESVELEMRKRALRFARILPDGPEKMNEWAAIDTYVNNEIPKLLTNIETQFRALIGGDLLPAAMVADRNTL